MVSLFNRRASDKRKAYTHKPHTDTHMAADSDELIIPDYDRESDLSAHEDKPKKNTHAQVTPPQDTPQVFAFMGASGGVGTTSLATQIAYELAMSCRDSKAPTRQPKDPQVCLIDLDFEGGTCAYHLDLLPSLSINDLTGDAMRIDTTFTSALVSTHQSGVSLLAVPNTPQANQFINPHAVMAMLDAATQLYKYVIIDMPRYSQKWTPAIMTGADFVGILSELTISSLHMARSVLNIASDTIGDTSHCHPILTKYERRSFKNTLQINDAQTVLGRDVIGTICIDMDTCREAINCGEPVGALLPNARYVKDSRLLIQSIFKELSQSNSSEAIQLNTKNTSKRHAPLNPMKVA